MGQRRPSGRFLSRMEPRAAAQTERKGGIGMAKIAIIGAGQVGASCAFALAQTGLARQIALADIREYKARGEALDIAHGAALLPSVRVEGGGYEVIDEADLAVMTAGANQAPGESRRDLLQKNIAILRAAAGEIARRAPRAVLLVVANPVDALTRAAIKATGFPPARVLGSGTVLDSLRLRFMLSEHTGIDASSIHACVLGEHGESELPAWSSMSIAGMTLEEYCNDCGGCDARLPEVMRAAFDREVRRAAERVIAWKGATFYAIAVAVRRIAQAILRDERSILTVSSLLAGEYGLENVCLSLPCVVGRAGVLRRIPVKLAADELAALRASAEAIMTMDASAERSFCP